MKNITFIFLVTFLFIGIPCTGMTTQTDWWVLQNHWDKCATKEHDLDLEYMARAYEYSYLIPHKNPIQKIAILVPPTSDQLMLDSIGCFEKDILFNTKEMEREYKIPPKKWVVVKGFKETYEILGKNNLYDRYQTWVANEFIDHRSIDKELLSKMAIALDVDTFLLFIVGSEKSGTATAPFKSKATHCILEILLVDAKEGKLIWEYGCVLYYSKYNNSFLVSQQARGKNLYRSIYKIMPDM